MTPQGPALTTIDEPTRERLRAALTSTDLHLVHGFGDAEVPGEGETCTYAEIMLVLTGRLSEEPHPCVSEVIRVWTIRIQDAMPDDIRNSAAWREAAIGIAGSASTPEVDNARWGLVLDWMWNALGDEAVLAAIPGDGSRSAWNAMLTERAADPDALYPANLARAAGAANFAASHGVHAYVATVADAVISAGRAAAFGATPRAAAVHAYWTRRDPPGTLAALIALGVTP